MKLRKLIGRLFDSPGVDLTSADIFDLDYYRSRYADLASSSARQTRSHWLSQGLREGRQGSPGFHPREYLESNSDLMESFGEGAFAPAAEHYLKHGLAEGRSGRCPDKVLRLQGSEVSLKASSNWGNVTWSLRWKGREFLNSHDLGRCLTVAWQEDGLLEGRNPTEGGNILDSARSRCWGVSSSRSLAAEAVEGRLSTVTRPAYWLPPGHPGSKVQSVLSPSVLSKTVTTDYLGSPHILRWEVEILFRGQRMLGSNQVQMLTLFACSDLRNFWAYHAEAEEGDRLKGLDVAPGQIWDPCGLIVDSQQGDLSDAVRRDHRLEEVRGLLTPRHGGVIVSDESGESAIGIYADSATSGREHRGWAMSGPDEVCWAVRNLLHLGRSTDRGRSDDDAAAYLSSVTRFRPRNEASYRFEGFVVVGSLKDVAASMDRLYRRD